MTQKPKLEPGQRIKFVGPMLAPSGPDHGWKVGEEFRTGRVAEEWPDGTVFLVCGGKIHRRQVTHALRPKQKPEKERNRPGGYAIVHGGDKFPDATIDFAWTEKPPGRYRMVELRSDEVVLPLDRAHRHFRKAAYQALGATDAAADQAFELFCKNLGLGKDKA